MNTLGTVLVYMLGAGDVLKIYDDFPTFLRLLRLDFTPMRAYNIDRGDRRRIPRQLPSKEGKVIPMHNVNYELFFRCVQDLLDTPEVQSMRQYPHHPHTTCYEHSVCVAYVSYRLARRWGLDYRAAARAGLLHDLYLYDARQKPSYYGNQCFAHPVAALKNAWALCGSLTPMEENIIVSHMWPLARRMPRYRESLVVNLADKLCATAEVVGLRRFSRRMAERARTARTTPAAA